MLRKFSLILFSLLLGVPSMLADYADHGRYSDLYDDYSPSTFSIILPAIILGGIVILVIVGLVQEAWKKHKDSIQGFLGFSAIIAGVIIFGNVAHKCDSDKGNNKSIAVSTPKSTVPQQTNAPSYYQYRTTQQRQLKYRTESYDEDCTRCNGRGSIVCNHCEGKGYVKQPCRYCDGKGEKQVYKVVRSTIDLTTWEEKDKVYGYESEFCTACMGKGYSEVKCSHCDNDYPYSNPLFSTSITCPSCNGQGVLHKTRQVPYYE